jgi:hypothetical protein
MGKLHDEIESLHSQMTHLKDSFKLEEERWAASEAMVD